MESTFQSLAGEWSLTLQNSAPSALVQEAGVTLTREASVLLTGNQGQTETGGGISLAAGQCGVDAEGNVLVTHPAASIAPHHAAAVDAEGRIVPPDHSFRAVYERVIWG